MAARYELFDHTADVGVRIRAPSLADLVPPAIEGLYEVIGDIATTRDVLPWRFEASGNDPSLLLRDCLADLLLMFDTQHRRITDIAVQEFTTGHLLVTGHSRAIDMARSHFEREVKAITYHELAVRETPDGCEATYIVDI